MTLELSAFAAKVSGTSYPPFDASLLLAGNRGYCMFIFVFPTIQGNGTTMGSILAGVWFYNMEVQACIRGLFRSVLPLVKDEMRWGTTTKM